MTEAEAYIAAIADSGRREEAVQLDELFRRVTGFPPRLWSGRMIGYGAYDYVYESGHSGTSLATGFAVAPRQISIYVTAGHATHPEIMSRLGKHKTGKSCVYISRLDQIDKTALGDLIGAGLADLATCWPIRPS